MTTEELLQVIANAKAKREVVPAYADTLGTADSGVFDRKAVNAAIVTKWSRNALVDIIGAAWQLKESQTAGLAAWLAMKQTEGQSL